MDTEPKNSLVKVNRRDLSEPVIKKLFALSGNQCAMPNCGVKLAYQDIHKVKAIICHIEGAAKGGPRHNPQQAEEERNDYPNLIVLCPNCHAEIDANPQKYPAEYLLMVKQTHEAKFKKNPYQLPDDIAEIMKVSVNQDEFSLNEISIFLAIYLEIKQPETKKYFDDNRLRYALTNLTLKTLESDSATKSKLDDIFELIGKLTDHEFVDCILVLGNNIPQHILEEYVEKNRDRLEKIEDNSEDTTIYWLIRKQNEESLAGLIDGAQKYSKEKFKDLLDEFKFDQFDNDKKLNLEKDIWKRLDNLDKNSNTYCNLLEADTKLFISLRLASPPIAMPPLPPFPVPLILPAPPLAVPPFTAIPPFPPFALFEFPLFPLVSPPKPPLAMPFTATPPLPPLPLFEVPLFEKAKPPKPPLAMPFTATPPLSPLPFCEVPLLWTSLSPPVPPLAELPAQAIPPLPPLPLFELPEFSMLKVPPSPPLAELLLIATAPLPPLPFFENPELPVLPVPPFPPFDELL